MSSPPPPWPHSWPFLTAGWLDREETCLTGGAPAGLRAALRRDVAPAQHRRERRRTTPVGPSRGYSPGRRGACPFRFLPGIPCRISCQPLRVLWRDCIPQFRLPSYVSKAADVTCLHGSSAGLTGQVSSMHGSSGPRPAGSKSTHPLCRRLHRRSATSATCTATSRLGAYCCWPWRNGCAPGAALGMGPRCMVLHTLLGRRSRQCLGRMRDMGAQITRIPACYCADSCNDIE